MDPVRSLLSSWSLHPPVAALAALLLWIALADSALAEDRSLACNTPQGFPEQAGNFLWLSCRQSAWRLRHVAEEDSPVLRGRIEATADFTVVAAVNLGPEDRLNHTGDRIDFELRGQPGGQSGFNFALPRRASACVRIIEGDRLRIGHAARETARRFDLGTLAPCNTERALLSVEDVRVSESDAHASFLVRRSGGLDQPVSVNYRTVAGTATADQDFIATAGTLTIPAGAVAGVVPVSLRNDGHREPRERFRLEFSDSGPATLLDPIGLAVIDDDEPQNIACGTPRQETFDQPAVYLWKSCFSSEWKFRAFAGAPEPLLVEGSISAAEPFVEAAPVSLEAGDSLTPTGPAALDFSLTVSSQWVDGVDFTPASDRGTCFHVHNPDDLPVLVGADRVSVQTPFDLGSLGACQPDQDAPPPFNVVVVLTDDQRFDTLSIMPHVRSRLVPEGVNFGNAYVPTPLCCPARASILSGGFLSQNTGVLDNNAPNGGHVVFNDASNLGVRMQGAGYRTLFVGKWLNDYVKIAPYVPPGWDDFLGRAVYATVADWFSFSYASGSSGPSSPATGVLVEAADQYHANFERDRIARFIADTPPGSPYFVFWSTTAPHGPAIPDEADAGLFADFRYRGRGYGEEDVSDKPAWVRRYNPDGDLSGDAGVRNQLRTLVSVDRGIGTILDIVEARGELDRTVFVITSDNGYMWGEHGAWGKNKAYEESLRVPMLAVVPGVPARREDKLVSAVLDLGPTLFDIAGVDAPSDGRSLLPLIHDPDHPWRTALFFEKYVSASYPNAQWGALRRRDWKYVHYWTGEEELYDLASDPYENENLAGDPAHAATQEAVAAEVAGRLGLSVKPDYTTPTGRVGGAYAFSLETWGGLGPFTWEVESGDLPPGLSLNRRNGRVSGVPTRTGEWDFAIRVTDSALATQAERPRTFVTRTLTIRVQ